jgi:hypothetical protein
MTRPSSHPRWHVLTAEDRLKASSPEARQKVREAFALEAELVREDVKTLHEWGMVDGAIATRLGLQEETVARWLAGKRVRTKYGRGYITRAEP